MTTDLYIYLFDGLFDWLVDLYIYWLNEIHVTIVWILYGAVKFLDGLLVPFISQ